MNLLKMFNTNPLKHMSKTRRRKVLNGCSTARTTKNLKAQVMYMYVIQKLKLNIIMLYSTSKKL